MFTAFFLTELKSINDKLQSSATVLWFLLPFTLVYSLLHAIFTHTCNNVF